MYLVQDTGTAYQISGFSRQNPGSWNVCAENMERQSCKNISKFWLAKWDLV